MTFIEALQNGTVSALATLRYFQQRALDINRKHNCIVDYVGDADQWAQQLDADFAGEEKPLLFGLPFSVKENLQVIHTPINCKYA
jgi:Asp-tRNA(Asn)/Glu-tRNA(Gln) amidotransferase A subunit family amidase